jgi:hypothetical protein
VSLSVSTPTQPPSHTDGTTLGRYRGTVTLPRIAAGDRDALAAALAAVWEPIEPGNASTGSCVASARVGVEVLRRLGLNAQAVSCGVSVMNLEAARLHAAGIPLAQWPESAWSVGVAASAGTSWDAHVVVQWDAGGNRGLVDLDLGRYARPQYNLHPKSVAVRYPSRRATDVSFIIAGSTVVHWVLHPEQTGFKKVSQWRQLDGWFDALVDRYLEAVPDMAAQLLSARKAGVTSQS